jgi:rubredoxin
MKQYMRCKACGYIMEADKVGDLCPACGVSAKVFEAYEEKISEKRKRILDMHIHPIVVHLAQAIVPMLVVLAAALAILGEGRVRNALLDTTRVLSIFLPFSVVLAFAAGLFDGNLRFHKVTTPLLVRKIVVGSLFFAASVGAGLLAFLTDLEGAALAPFALLQVFSFASAVFLGNAGFGLLFSRFPG